MNVTFSAEEMVQIHKDIRCARRAAPLGKAELAKELVLVTQGGVSLGSEVALIAAQKGHVATLRYLKEQGVDLSRGKPADLHITPLFVAAVNGQSAAVEFLKDLPEVDMSKAVEPLRPGWVSLATYVKQRHYPELAAKIEGWANEAKNKAPVRNDAAEKRRRKAERLAAAGPSVTG